MGLPRLPAPERRHVLLAVLEPAGAAGRHAAQRHLQHLAALPEPGAVRGAAVRGGLYDHRVGEGEVRLESHSLCFTSLFGAPARAVGWCWLVLAGRRCAWGAA